MGIRQLLSVFVVIFMLFADAQAAEPSSGANVASSSSSGSSEVPKADSAEKRALVEQAEKIKKELIQLNRELYQFEEDLLYPANTQLAVFLSLSEDSKFLLDSIELRLDDQMVSSYLYTESEIDALKKGGVQRIYLGSLSDGSHKLTAQFNGQGANDRYFRRKKALRFTKDHDAKFIQMVISESSTTREPLFKVKQW